VKQISDWLNYSVIYISTYISRKKMVRDTMKAKRHIVKIANKM